MKKKVTVFAIMMAVVCAFSACSSGDDGDEGSTTVNVQESLSGEEETSENVQNEKGYSFDTGEWWRYAYDDEQYVFYYMNETAEVYDTNVILSITDDENLKGVSAKALKNTLEEQYGEAAKLEKGKINGCEYVYMETEQAEGNQKAYVGQYILIGNETSVIFSVYAHEDKFRTALEKTENVLETAGFE